MDDKTFALNGIDFSPEINLARYLQSIRKFPILTQEEEFAMASEYKETKDPKISYKLITSHLRLVVKVVSKYKGYGLPLSEMRARQRNSNRLQAFSQSSGKSMKIWDLLFDFVVTHHLKWDENRPDFCRCKTLNY